MELDFCKMDSKRGFSEGDRHEVNACPLLARWSFSPQKNARVGKNMKAFRILAILVLLGGCAVSEKGGPARNEYDVALLATPLSGKELQSGAVIDAIENTPNALQNARFVISFRIDRVLIGELPKEKVGGRSRWDQAVEAAAEKKIMKFLTLDFKNPNEEIDKLWFRVAVQDPGATFGINDWHQPAQGRYKLYLKRMPKQTNSYVLVHCLPL
jgi:hypothetical protein